MIKDKHQYHVCGWMINQLHLEGRELQCYAIIYSLSQLGEGRYIAGLKFLAEFMQCTQPTASSAIKGLFDKGLIKKDEIVTELGRRVFYYCSDPDIEEECINNPEGCKNNSEGVNKKFMDGVNKKFMSKYNIEENKKENNKKKLSNDNSKEYKVKRFVKPTIDQIADYIKENNLHFDAEAFFDSYESKGWLVGKSPMKDWKAACRTWEHNRKRIEKKEEVNEEIPDERKDGWERSKEWMHKFIPRIADRISFTDFDTMRGTVYHNREVFSEILHEINNSDYEGDIVAEFCRLAQTERYNQKIFGV